jgi:hypothetical protein
MVLYLAVTNVGERWERSQEPGLVSQHRQQLTPALEGVIVFVPLLSEAQVGWLVGLLRGTITVRSLVPGRS